MMKRLAAGCSSNQKRMISIGEEVVDLNDESTDSSNDSLWDPSEDKTFRLQCPQTHKKLWELEASLIREPQGLQITWKPQVKAAAARANKGAVDKLIPPEQTWLNGYRSFFWSDVVNRISRTDNQTNDLIEDAKRYLDHNREKELLACADGESSFELRYEMMKVFAAQYIDEIVADMALEAVQDVMQMVSKSIDVLSRPMLRALLDINEGNQRFLKRSGKLHMLRGAIEDFALNRNSFLGDDDSDLLTRFPECVFNLDELASPAKRPPPPSSGSQRPVKPMKTIHISNSKYCINDISNAALCRRETTHMLQVTAHLLTASPLTAKHSRITTANCFAQRDEQESILVAGSHTGHIHVWKLSWAQDSAQFIGMSNQKTKTDRSALMQLDKGPDGVHSIIVKSAKAQVAVWDLEPLFLPLLEKPPRGCSFFCQPPSTTNNAQRMFTMNQGDMLYFFDNDIVSKPSPYPPSRTFVQTFKEKVHLPSSNTIKSQRAVTCNTFFPSLTVNGRATAILIGADDGDIIKFNMDCMNKHDGEHLENPLHAFVDKELINPYLAPKGHVLQAGNKAKKGNKVFREMFHFHTSPIKLLHVIRASSMNDTACKFLSMDAAGHVALWSYSPRYFHGVCWFLPQQTAAISFEVVAFENQAGASEDEGDSGFQDTMAPDANMLRELLCESVGSTQLLQSQHPHQAAVDSAKPMEPTPQDSPPPDSSPRRETRRGSTLSSISPRSLSPRRSTIAPDTLPTESIEHLPDVTIQALVQLDQGTVQQQDTVAVEELQNDAPTIFSANEIEHDSIQPNSVDLEAIAAHGGILQSSIEENSNPGADSTSGPIDQSSEGDVPEPLAPVPADQTLIDEHSLEIDSGNVLPVGDDIPSDPHVTSPVTDVAEVPQLLGVSVIQDILIEEPKAKPPSDCNLSLIYHPIELIKASSDPTEQEAVNPTGAHVMEWFQYRCLKRVSGISNRIDETEAPIWQRRKMSRNVLKVEPLHVVPSNDDLEVLFVFRVVGNTRRLILASLICSCLEFHHPNAFCQLEQGEDLLSVASGPVMLETMTRAVFLLTNRKLMAFSLHTGHEMQFNSADIQSFIRAHKPRHLVVCNSQRMLFLFSGKDTKIYPFALKHNADGKQGSQVVAATDPMHAILSNILRDTMPDLLDSSPWQRSDAELRDVAVSTILDHSMAQETGEDAESLVRSLLEDIIEEAIIEGSEAFQDKLRAGYISDMFGSSSNLGHIPPTSWPPTRVSVWERRRLERNVAEAKEDAEMSIATELLHGVVAVEVRDIVDDIFDDLMLEKQAVEEILQQLLSDVTDTMVTESISAAQAELALEHLSSDASAQSLSRLEDQLKEVSVPRSMSANESSVSVDAPASPLEEVNELNKDPEIEDVRPAMLKVPTVPLLRQQVEISPSSSRKSSK